LTSCSSAGRLGNGCSLNDRLSPSKLEVCPMAVVFSGYNHAFAISTDHYLYAWGNNAYGMFLFFSFLFFLSFSFFVSLFIYFISIFIFILQHSRLSFV
jgi:hypothetical protein